ncbi:Isochorismate synthase DhbC [Pseudoclavibacter triregionum]|nr:Isochorismate synthase DhbC [Pseudoclavibacter triregionum]
MSTASLPRLRARTIRVEGPLADALAALPLERLADPLAPLLWLRRGEGVVGVALPEDSGLPAVAWRAEFRGERRFEDAAGAWASLLEAAEIDDEARMPGTGLLAFGAFAFAAGSAQASVLAVPTLLVGRRGGAVFATAATADGSDPGAILDRLDELARPRPEGPDPRAAFRDGEMTVDRHRRAVDHAIDLINQGQLSKLVLARDVAGRIPADADRRHVLARLSSGYPECWAYAVDGLLGASPETLVRVIGRAVTARVLAGTAPRADDPAEDRSTGAALFVSRKNRAEHAFAVDSALASLGALDADDHDEPGTSLTASPEPFLLKLPNVWHLASDLRGELPEGRTVLDLVEALHPTAAVGGTPRDRALDAIDRLEPFDRRRYAGPVGWLSSSGEGEWAIALRGAEIDPDGAVTAYAGGGIVATSDPLEEFRETEWKLRPLLDALGRGGAAAFDRPLSPGE